MLGDNLSNKCEDDRSNANDNDDMSSKSYKSKRSEGLVDTASMKSLIIDEARKRQNKVFYDRG
jgi:DNA helicase IV